jgi:predicted ATPase/DNA-binding SARP family transcriptional activator
MRVDINLLGGFSVVVDGRPVAAQAWTRSSAATLVKLLALRPGRRLPREQVMDLLWPDLLLDQAAPRLHKAAHYARMTLGIPTAVVLSGDAVALLPDERVVVDVEVFDEAASAQLPGGDASAAEKAIELYAGDLLPEDLYEPWAGAERERLRTRYLGLLRATGRWADLLTAEPLDEEAHLRVVHQYVEDGNRGQALRHLDSMAQLWRDELGAEPGAAAQALRAQAEAMSAYDPARGIPNCIETCVPRPATQTVGRDHDIARVLSMLDRHRLVTLLGIGGVGKTRLAAEVAHRYVEATSERACYVDLTKVREAGLVPELTVRELGIRAGENQDVVQMLEEALRRQSLLLVLDNFEHVVDAADLVGEMVRWSDDLRVLVTSRARLRVAGEKVFEVLPLSLEPEAGAGGLADAVALFEQVAKAVDPWFELEQHIEDVEAICRSVDGLPLAIEIAGGHARTLPPPLLRQRLAGRLGSAAAAGRDLPDRQQTIPATIDWSLKLLGPREQRLFARFAVFNCGVPLEAVEAVWPDGDVVDPLSVLVDHSLVRRRTGNRAEPRFGMLELVREHAARLLDDQERETVAAAHAAYVAAFVEDLFERRWTDAAGRWLDDITELLAEVRAAHDWAWRHGDLALTARITAALGAYWHLEGHHAEGQRWVGEMLASEDELDPAVAARIRLAAGFLEFPRSQSEARRHWQRATDLFRQLGETRLLAYALAVTSATYLGEHEQYSQAMRINDEALALGRSVGGPALIAQVLNVRGELTRVAGEDGLAQAAYEEGLQISRTIGDEIYVSVFLANLSYLADHRGDYQEARRLTREALRICWSLGRRMMAAWTISELAGPEHGLGHSERGAVLIGAADGALQVLGSRRHPGDLPEHDRVVAGIRAALGEEQYERLHAEGARMSLDEALALVLEDEDEASLQPSATR